MKVKQTMGIPFAYSTNAYTKTTLHDAISRIAGCGFTGVEILADTPHAVPEILTNTELEHIRQLLSSTGLSISNINVNTSHAIDTDDHDSEGFWPSLIDPDVHIRQRKIDYVIAALRMTKQLGGTQISITTGKRIANTDIQTADHLFMSSLHPILDEASALGLRVGVECEPLFHIEHLDHLLQIIDRINHPELGINLDIGHAIVVDDPIIDIIRSQSHRIWNIHLEDIADRVHEHMIPGKGNIDFVPILQALTQTPYEGFLTLELYPYTDIPDEAGREGIAYLNNLMSW